MNFEARKLYVVVMASVILLVSARRICYFIMEVTSKYILQVQIVDKRHVGLVSSNMEVEGLKKSLKKIQEDLNVVELVTDALSSVKKLLGRLKLTN